MTTSVDFGQLTDTVKQAQDEIKSAAAQNRAQLQAKVERARNTAEQQASKI